MIKRNYIFDNEITLEIVKDNVNYFTDGLFLKKNKKKKENKKKEISLLQNQNNLKWSKLLKNEDSYRILFEHVFWENGIPTCPMCGIKNNYYVINCGENGRHKLQRYKCISCGKKFSIKTGTFMHKSKLSLEQWFWIIYYLVVSKLEITSSQIMKELFLSHKSAYYAIERFLNTLDTKTFIDNYICCKLDLDIVKLLKTSQNINNEFKEITPNNVSCKCRKRKCDISKDNIELIEYFENNGNISLEILNNTEL